MYEHHYTSYIIWLCVHSQSLCWRCLGANKAWSTQLNGIKKSRRKRPRLCDEEEVSDDSEVISFY